MTKSTSLASPTNASLRRNFPLHNDISWWSHQMETFSALLAICAVNSPVPGEFTTQRPVTRSFDVFFDLRLNKRLSKQSWGWWLETLSCSLWVIVMSVSLTWCYHTYVFPWGPLYLHILTLNPVWISNHMPNKMWDEIIYSFPNFNGLGMDK